MESLPIGLTKKKKNKKKQQHQENENKNDIINEIVLNQVFSLLIKTTMEECDYFPKTNYFINSKNDDIFPEKYIFSKIFPKLTEFFENLDQKFSEENKPFWYTSGKIGPYFINTHFVYGNEKDATELLSFIDNALSDKITLPKIFFVILNSKLPNLIFIIFFEFSSFLLSRFISILNLLIM